MNDAQTLAADEQLALLSFATRLLLSAGDRETLIERGLEAICESAAGRRAALLMRYDGENGLELHDRDGGAEEVASGSPLAQAMEKRTLQIFPLAAGDSPRPGIGDSSETEGPGCLCLPLIGAAHEAIGVVTVELEGRRRPGPAEAQGLHILQSVLALGMEQLAAADELASLNRAKSRMIEHLSHELRTPLAVLLSGSSLLARDKIRQDPERARSVLERMRRSLERLEELQQETLAIARGDPAPEAALLGSLLDRCGDLLQTVGEEAGAGRELGERLRARLEALLGDADEGEAVAIDVGEWLPAVLQEIAPRHEQRDVDVGLAAEAGCRVRLPAAGLQRAVVGLVRNAIEATPDGGRIEISARRQGDEVILVVADRGVGMDEELQSELFHGFVHAGASADYSTGRPYDLGAGGRGLDLLCTRLFCERWGARLAFASELGRGSTFELGLPAAEAPAPRGALPRDQRSG